MEIFPDPNAPRDLPHSEIVFSNGRSRIVFGRPADVAARIEEHDPGHRGFYRTLRGTLKQRSQPKIDGLPLITLAEFIDHDD